jgi:Protein of unknown function (DUF2934)
MATRRTSKAQSRPKHALEPDGGVASISPNGESKMDAASAKKVASPGFEQKQATEPTGAGVPVSFNGESKRGNSTAKNGTSPGFEQIQRRAYELYMARGGTHGCDWADWFIAEQELTSISGADH